MEPCTFVAMECTFEASESEQEIGKQPEDRVIPCTFEAHTNNTNITNSLGFKSAR